MRHSNTAGRYSIHDIEAAVMADRVFIADYIKKKRRRKGNIEFLVKWKGYPTRLCTWEPHDNILDASLIEQFEEEGYDPRKVRLACRKKKRRRSEITESRTLILPFYDSDSEHEPRTPPHDLLNKHKSKVSPISLSKYGGVWQADATYEEGDTLFQNEAEHEPEQKKRQIDLTAIGNKENSDTSLGTMYKNGGKSCHPKMRAKFMFRSGDFENVDWGYDWSSSDNESLKGTSNKDCTDQRNNIDSALHSTTSLLCKPLTKRNSFSEISSITSESTVAAIEDLESPAPATDLDLDWNRPGSCPSLDNTCFDESFAPIWEEDEHMPTLMNERYVKSESVTQHLTDQTIMDQTLQMETKKVETVTPRSDVSVTEVTLNNLTVTIQESDKMKGFFRW